MYLNVVVLNVHMLFIAKLASLNINPNNSYQVFEKCKEFGLAHDATTNWVKELNTILIKVVGKDGTLFKVPFSFDRVPRSFTGEALGEELIQKISSVKVLNEMLLKYFQMLSEPFKKNLFWKLN